MDSSISSTASLFDQTPTVQEAFNRAAGDSERQAFAPFGSDGFSFLDVLDIINPLQHLPVISTLYRQVTGDTGWR